MAVSDTNYAALYNLTALASQGNGITATGINQLDLVNQLYELETNFNAILTKLDSDAGVNSTAYNSTYAIDLDDTVYGSKGISQKAIVDVLDTFVENFNDTLTVLDNDSGTTDSDYNSTLAITDVVNSNTKSVLTAVDNAGMSQQALYTLLSTIVTNVNALNAKLDAD